MFKSLDSKKSIPEIEQDVLTFWQKQQIFAKSLENRADSEPFVFYEGPPTANGRPGIHHVLARTFKDTICRYQTMKGKYVVRKAGWDTHGLPVELQVEKELGLKSKQDIERYGIAKFNQQCRESVWRYKEEWEKLTERIGFWIDLSQPYVTYEPDYIESVWWGLRQIWDKGLIYQDYKVLPYCPRCGTPLSAAEVALGYQDVAETSVYVKFALADEAKTFVLAWTTTPWTLPGNVALAVNPKITYVAVVAGGETYYLAKDRLSVLQGEYQILRELPGTELIGKRYKPLFDFIDLAKEAGKDAYRVVGADFVSTEDGTGVVHTAVMYGEEDFELGKVEDLPFVHTVDERGMFKELVVPWQGQFVKDVESEIVSTLAKEGKLEKSEKITHTYPFCWRCGTPLLYYARSSWFIRIDQALRDRLVALNQTIKWVPEHLRDGRFGNWLAGLRDWAISRERYWGTPLPIWICQADSAHQSLIGSIDELTQRAVKDQGLKIKNQKLDLHKPYIDEIELACPECDGIMRRVPEVVDVWLDSGSMPYAQWHYPTENEERFKSQFPADFIAEAIDQTRGWYNSLLILSTIIFDQVAYRSVITGNHILDEKGQKMSKSKGNVVDPWSVIAKVGADTLRLYMLAVNQPGDSKNFSPAVVTEFYRKTIMIWWNVVNFFTTYATLDKWQLGQEGTPTVLDRWIKAKLSETVREIDSALSDLDTFTAARTFSQFIDDLSTWYLRRSRKRRDKAFYSTMHEVLVTSAQLAAPLMPFMAEATYQRLMSEAMAESVHLTDFPLSESADKELLVEMAAVRELTTLGHAARAAAKVKLRQPLAKAVVTSKQITSLPGELQEILADELNVKQVVLAAKVPEAWWRSADLSHTVALDPAITSELAEEGTVRELIREVQEFRKKAGCQPGQLVDLRYETDDSKLEQIIEKNRSLLSQETGARELQKKRSGEAMVYEQTVAVDDHSLTLGLHHAP